MSEYTWQEAASYGGFIVGAVVVFTALERFGISSYLAKIIPAVLVGMLCGWIADKLAKAKAGGGGK